jgi:hypothetical protein
VKIGNEMGIGGEGGENREIEWRERGKGEELEGKSDNLLEIISLKKTKNNTEKR